MTLRGLGLRIELLAAPLLDRAGQAEETAQQHLAEAAQLGQFFASDWLLLVGGVIADVPHCPRPLGDVCGQLARLEPVS